MGYSGILERKEVQHIRLVLEPDDIRKYEKRLNKIFSEYNFKIYKDRLNINFEIVIEYDGIVKRIELLLEMLREKDHRLIEIDVKEVEHGKCLIQDLYLLFDELERRLNNKPI